MSFIKNDNTAKVYAPGYFIVQDDETVTRETREIPATMATTAADGTKYVPMGTIFPSNDAYATGIVYEDVDVSSGDMPGSVVTKATVYEDKLAMTGYDYDAVTVGDYVSPVEQGWYESDGEVSPTYTLSTDTKANGAKTYYAKSGDTYSAVTVGNYVSPAAQGWYESDGGTGYVASTDTTAGAKTYYARSIVRMASAAKSALEALGFKFVSSTPRVTRPY